MGNEINIVVFRSNKDPIRVIGIENQKLIDLFNEAWLKLMVALRNFPNKEENVHTIEVYMPGTTPPQTQVAGPYHECQFLLTECGVPGYIRSLMTA